MEETEVEVNKFCKSQRSVEDVLTKLADLLLQDDEPQTPTSPDDEDIVLDDDFPTEEIKPKTQGSGDLALIQQIEGEFNTKAHPNQVAIQRLIKDYLTVCKTDSTKLGYKADPVNKNLFLWHVKFFGFKGSSKKDDIDEKNIHDDLQKFSKSHSQDYILFEMKFPEKYPFKVYNIFLCLPFAVATIYSSAHSQICAVYWPCDNRR